MKVVLQTGASLGWAEPLGRPWPLLPVGNRPWVEYWIEWCVAQELRDFHVVLGEGAYEIENYLGDGRRWGITIEYSFLRDPDDPDAFLRRDPARWSSGLLYLRRPVFPRRLTDDPPAALPDLTLASYRPDGLDVFFSRQPADLQRLLDGPPPAAQPFPSTLLVPQALESLHQYFELNMSMVEGEIARYLTPGYRRQDKAYLGYNVIYPATAHLAEPLMIGNDVRLRALCSVGPRAIIGNRVIVDRQAEITDSIVFDGTYLGEGIELKGRIAVGRRLIDPTDGTALDLDDTHLLAPLRVPGAGGEKARRLAHRLVALILFVVLSPMALLALLIGYLRGGRMRRVNLLGVRGPVTVGQWQPGHRRSSLLCRFSLDLWPLLGRVVRGQLWLCGQLPVRADEADEVRSWPTYRPGVFTYADMRPDREDPVQRRIEAAYYAHHRGWGEDLRILLRGWWARLAGHNCPTDDAGTPA